MSTDRVDTRPLRTAAAAQAPLVAVGTLGAGLGPAYLAFMPPPLGRIDILVALALSVAPAVWAQMLALARTVRRGERDTTPWRDARDDQGRPLRLRSANIVEQLLDDRLRDLGYQVEPGPPPNAEPVGPDGTRAHRVVDPARYADGPPSKQHDPNWDGSQARQWVEAWRDRSGDPRVRHGRDIADRADRRAAHSLRTRRG